MLEENYTINLAAAAVAATYPADRFGAVYLGTATATGVYAHTGRTITQAGAFAAYSFTAGDWYFVASGAVAPVRPGWYKVASKTSNNVIVLDGDGMGSASDGATTLVGMVHKRGVFVPEGPGSMISPEAARGYPFFGVKPVVISRIIPSWTTAPAAISSVSLLDLAGATVKSFTLGNNAALAGVPLELNYRVPISKGVGALISAADALCTIAWREAAAN